MSDDWLLKLNPRAAHQIKEIAAREGVDPGVILQRAVGLLDWAMSIRDDENKALVVQDTSDGTSREVVLNFGQIEAPQK
ncbi:MAG: hypothetical protein RL701_5500 [Pseudomonadota bacterium]|jgi:hypothetical protein